MAEPSSNKQTVMILAFAAGVLVGMNWPKIKQGLGPMIKTVTEKSSEIYAGISKFMAEQKETMEDKAAAATVRKVKKTKSVHKRPAESMKVSV